VTSIGQTDGLYSSLEIKALWNLAQLSGENARVKDLYFEKALSSKEALKQCSTGAIPLFARVLGCAINQSHT